jgi:acyl-coenzyme A synthetase/AMP-(fatty) acid ligase
VLGTVPAHHIYGLLFTVVLPLLAGARFVRDTPLMPSVIEEYARRCQADVLVSVPPHLRVLGESELSTLGSIGRVFSSGAPLPDAAAHTLRKRFDVRVIEVLGSTETGGFAYRCFEDASQAHGERFRPFAGVSITTDEADQLCLRSPLLDASITQPLVCPDRIELLQDGSFRHLGRSDGVIKVGGTRISLSELEARVRELPGVSDVAALPVDAGGARGQEIWLVVATAEGRELTELRARLLRYYDPVLLPRRVRFVESLPREATGKLMRARLLELFASPKAETMQP